MGWDGWDGMEWNGMGRDGKEWLKIVRGGTRKGKDNKRRDDSKSSSPRQVGS